jgi:hypothetical protein
MASDLTLVLENRPGTLADLGEALGRAGINLGGICGVPGEAGGLVHLLVDDAAAARKAIEAAGMTVRGERPVLVTNVQDRPGELGRICRRLADQGINIELIYLATGTRLVLAADNLDKARAAL